MKTNKLIRRRFEHVVLLLGLALLLFASPLSEWWADLQPPWYIPFILWGVLVFFIGLTSMSRHNDAN